MFERKDESAPIKQENLPKQMFPPDMTPITTGVPLPTVYVPVPGEKGEKGSKGDASIGPRGLTGVGISKVTMNADHSITFELSDGSKFTTPILKGRDGTDGEDGATVELDTEAIDKLIDGKLKGLEDKVLELSSDSMLTSGEKALLNTELSRWSEEYLTVKTQADLYQITSEWDSYSVAFTALAVYLSALLSVAGTSPIDKEEFQDKVTKYYAAKAIILKKIAEVMENNIRQTKLTAEGAAKITNFWRITLDDKSGLIAAGTMLVGTANYNNAGMTGVTDEGGDSVRFWAGTSYAQRNVAPWRVLDNGHQWNGTDESGWDWGITRPGRFSIRGGLNVDAGGNVSETDVFRGGYLQDTTYYPGNSVSYGGSLWKYVNESASMNHLPGEATDYWKLAVSKGEPGETGPTGVTLFTWIKYADDAEGNGMSEFPEGKSYIGLAYNQVGAEESSDPTVYNWAKFTGEGIKGPKGDDGIQLYTWVKYADSPTSGMSNDPTNKKYLGLAYNKTIAQESNVYTDYTWSLIQGQDGQPGQAGIGVEYRYAVNGSYTDAPTAPVANDSNPSGWSLIPPVFGVAEYLWRITAQRKADGTLVGNWSAPIRDTGLPGTKGQDGTPAYSVMLTNEVCVLPATSDGAVSPEDFERASSGVRAFKGKEELVWRADDAAPTAGQFRYTIDSVAGGTASRINNSNFRLETMPVESNNALITINVYCEGNVILQKTMSVTKSKAGTPGQNGQNGQKGEQGEQGQKGERGPTGPFLVDRGLYDPAAIYHGGTDYIEVVTFGTPPAAYHTRIDAGNFSGLAPWEDSKWNQFQVQFESLYVKILNVLTASIDNLVVKHLRTGVTGARIEITGNSDRSYHDNGVLATEKTIENGIVKEIWYDPTGKRTQDFSHMGIKYVEVLPASWYEAPLRFLTNNATATTQQLADIVVNNPSFLYTVTLSDGPQVGIRPSITAFYYNSPKNNGVPSMPDAEGYKNNNGSVTGDYIQDGWYAGATLLMPSNLQQQTYIIDLMYVVNGKIVNNLRAEHIPLSSTNNN